MIHCTPCGWGPRKPRNLVIFANTVSLSTNRPHKTESPSVLSVFWGWKRCARDLQIFGQRSRERQHDRTAHEQKCGNQNVSLGDIPQHEQEGAQGQPADANGDSPAKPSKKHPFQTRGGSIRFTGEPTLGATHAGGSGLATVRARNVVRVRFHGESSILGMGLRGVAISLCFFRRSSSTTLVPHIPPRAE